MNMANKIKAAFALAFLAQQRYERFIQLNPILLPPSFLSFSVSPRDEQYFSIYSFQHLLYLRVHVLSTESSFILFGVLFVRLSRIFIVPLAPLVSITIAASSSLIFSLWTIISDRLSPLFLAVFRFYLFFSLSFFSSHWLFIFIFLQYLSHSFILYPRVHLFDRFNYNFNLYFSLKLFLFFGKISWHSYLSS